MRTEVVDIQYASEVCGRIFDRSALMQFFFPLTIPNPSVNSFIKENDSLKYEITALKKNFEDFQNSLKLQQWRWSESKRVEYHRTRLRTPCNFMASLTMTFARKRIKVYSSSGRTWMSCLSEWKRLGIGLASRLALRLASSCFSSTPIVGLPEIKASESATDTTI